MGHCRYTGQVPENLTWTEDADHTRRLTDPVCVLSRTAGTNEDARGCDAIFFMTDTHTYFCLFDSTLDIRTDMQEVWQEAFCQLTLS